MPDARERLVDALREHALVIGVVTLTSGRKALFVNYGFTTRINPSSPTIAARSSGGKRAITEAI